MPTATSIRPAPDAREAPATRERILRVAFELIGREGMGAISNRRLAAAAGGREFGFGPAGFGLLAGNFRTSGGVL